MPGKQTVIDEYLAKVPQHQRPTLEHLRAVIKSVVPEAEEIFSYNIPAFRFEGNAVGGFSASRNHLSYFPFSGVTVDEFADELTDFETSKGTIRFQPDHQLPDDLVRRMVESRIAASRKK